MSETDETRPDGRTAADDVTLPSGPDGRTTADDVTLRFGPGVPPGVAEAWRRGRPRRRPVARRIAGGLLTLAVAVVAGLVVWWLLRGGGPDLEVTALRVSAPHAVQRCDSTVTVVGTIRTNGGHGDIAYRWRRSDGQDSGVFTESVHKGQRSLRVPLRWTVRGTGTLHAVATLEILAPKGAVTRASAAFDYACG